MAGPGPVIYLDVDDEITSAAARVRAVEGTRVALVVPPGSRIATSRINFRLLARDAGSHGRRLAVIAPDAASRALAAAAGLEVFSSVGDYETAMADPAARPPVDESAGQGGVGAAVIGAGAVAAGAAGAAAPGAAAGASGPTTPAPAPRGRREPAGTPAPKATAAAAAAAASDATTVMPTSPGIGTAAAQASEPDLRPRSAAATTSSIGGASRRRFGGGGLLVVAGLVILAGVVVAGVAGYLFLPSATVVVTPIEQTLGPTEVTVTADPDATAVDVTAGIVPADTRTFDVTAAGTYEATGERVEESTATGTIRWQNCDPTSSYTIPPSTVVRTGSGLRFTTDERVFLPVAILTSSPPSIDCQTRDVGITAVAAGPAGNVAAGTITVIPSSLNSVVITVRNPSATAGGARETFPKVTQADVDAALKDLDAKLAASFVAALAAPDAVPPDLTLFPETGQLGDAVPDSDPQALVDQEVATFDLAATATGTATAVDETPVAAVAEAQLMDSVSAGYVLVPGSVESTIGDPTVDGQTVTFPARAVAKEVRQLDATELESLILGLTPEAAEQALAPYGSAKITLSPDWATTIPTYAFRVDLTVDDGGSVASPGPSGSPARSPSASKSPARSPSPAPSASPTPS